MPLSNYGAARGIFREGRKEKTVTLLRSRKAHTQPTHAVPANLAISFRTFHRRKARHDQLGLRVGKMAQKICKVFQPHTRFQVPVYLNTTFKLNKRHSFHFVATLRVIKTYGVINKREII